MTPEEIKKQTDRASALVAQTEAQGATPFAGSSFNTNTITASDLTSVPTTNFQTPTTISAFPVGTLDTTVPLAPTAPETQATDLSTRLRDLNKSLLGESAFRAGQEAQAGVPELVKTQTDLSSRLKAIQAEAQAIPLQLQTEAEGRGITTGGLRPLETARLRANAIQALGVSSLLEASRGNLTTALDLVDRAVAQKFDPVREEINATTANLQLVLESPDFTRAEKNRAQAQLDIQNAKKDKLEQDQNNFKAIQNIALGAAQRGADALTLRKIQESTDPIEAQRIATEAGFGVPAETPDLQFISGTANQPAGVFNKKTGVFTPTGGGTKEPTIVDNSGNVLEYGTPDYVVARLKQTSGSKTKPVASEREQLGKFANVVALTDNLMGSLSKTTNDPILGYLRSLNPYDFNARAVNAQVIALVPSVARALYGEVGVLTDTDIERYLKTLPNIKSTADQNKFIATMTLANAKRSYEQTLLNLANSNVNVSGFADSYKALTDKLTKLEKSLGADALADIPNEKIDVFDSVVSQPKEGGYLSNLWNAFIGK